MKTICVLCVLTFALLAVPLADAVDVQPPPTPYVMGVFPFIPAANIEGVFAPLAAEISRAVGRPVKLRTSASFEKFMEELKAHAFDLAYIQPFDYVDIARPGGYLALVSRNDTLSSRIVVRQDSPIKNLQELKGKNMGMPPRVAALSFLNRLTLNKAGLVPDRDVKIVYLASHQACLQQLQIGTVAACGISPSALRLAEVQLKTHFKLIHESPEIPPPLFVVKKELPQRDRDAMLAVLIATDLSTVKPELRSMFIEKDEKPFRKTADKEYDAVRALMKAYGVR